MPSIRSSPWPTAISLWICILTNVHGRLVVLRNGRYDNMPIEVIVATKKVVNIKDQYNTERLRPRYKSFEMKPLFIMTSDLG